MPPVSYRKVQIEAGEEKRELTPSPQDDQRVSTDLIESGWVKRHVHAIVIGRNTDNKQSNLESARDVFKDI